MSKFHNYSFSFSDLRIDTMVDTVHVSRSMERNRDIGAKDFYMVQMSSGEVEYRGSLSLQQVLTLVKEMYMHEAEADTSRWIPSSPPPLPPAPLDQVMKKPDLVRMAAGDLMSWLLTYQGKQKPGEEGFLGWIHLVERDLFVINDKALSAIKGRFFSLEDIVPWSRMAQLRNGFKAGGRTLLLASSGVKAWLSFLRIFIEVGFQF